MIWELSDKVWWGNADCCRDVTRHDAGCVLNLAHNINDLNYDARNFIPEMPYFRLALPDECSVSEPQRFDTEASYFDMLMNILRWVDEFKWFPLLVHCRAGQHRSPNVAVMAECLYSGESWDVVMERAVKLRPDIESKPFAVSLKDCWLKLCVSSSV